MSDNYDGPQMAQKIMRQQAEIERLRIKNARLRALLTKRLEFLEERACEEFEPECAWCQSHQLWLEITHELALEDSAADQPAAVPEPNWPAILGACPEGELRAFFEDHPELAYVADQPAAVRVVFTMRECTACGAQWDYDRADCPRCARAADNVDAAQEGGR